MADHGIKGKTIIIAGGAKNLGGLIARDRRNRARTPWRSTTTVRRPRRTPTPPWRR